MDSNSKILSTAVPLLGKSVSSEDILAEKFFQSKASNYGKYLFYNWRFHEDGSLNDEFVLNRDHFFGKILLVEDSFSLKAYSEKAIQALMDYGFEAVVCPQIGSGFSDAASAQNLLSIEVSPDFGKKLINTSLIEPKSLILIDNDSKIIELKNLGISEKFNERNLSA